MDEYWKAYFYAVERTKKQFFLIALFGIFGASFVSWLLETLGLSRDNAKVVIIVLFLIYLVLMYRYVLIPLRNKYMQDFHERK